MPDITMCLNKNCKDRLKCYRFTAKPNHHKQSYMNNKYASKCKRFWDNKGVIENEHGTIKKTDATA